MMELQIRDKVWTSQFFHLVHEFYDLRGADALDMFARDGELTVQNYAYKVKNLDVWELSEIHQKALMEYRPRDLKIGCAYNQLVETQRHYDFIVIDNPQGVHHDGNHQRRFEHFSVIPGLAPIMNKKCVIVFYVNKQPYDKAEVGAHGMDDYEEYDYKKWIEAREDFYQYDPYNLTEEAAMRAYRAAFHRIGYKIKTQIIVPCHSDVPGREPYGFRLAIELERN